ncbi:hypothetical protein BDZ90DRAFT_280439 [Jaminaea rosea]|uniref:WD40 repeat-like protein n=1 Tax=Jaminaea rosea TaxID=1569628 RepID=A0A316UM79_9BASI|nr:hypothetical protein BDZ90DRAFT_280439 [Jaminaea rosea]PWN26396.1 hypothetical protein BDZ90DRAFT_280439 [Jaminaea rosea]
MHLPRHTLQSQTVAPSFLDAQFAPSAPSSSTSSSTSSNAAPQIFGCATRSGFLIGQTHPLKVVARRDFPSNQGGLSHAVPLDDSSLLILVGGGRVPRFAPNKVVLWDEAATIEPEAEAQQRGDVEAKEEEDEELTTSPWTSSSRTASTLFDAGSAYGRDQGGASNAASISASTASLSGSSRMGLAGMRDDDDDDDDEPAASPPASMLSSTTEGLEDPFSETAATEATQPLSSQQSAAAPATATATAPAPASLPRTQRTGRPVLELEFGSPVRSVCVRSFSHPSTARPAALLVVVLANQAVLFEMGEHLPSGTSVEEEEKDGWGIMFRTSTPVLDDKKQGLADMVVLPQQRALLLALPGRQAGHVQLLLLSLIVPRRTGAGASQSTSTSTSGLLASTIIAAHEAPLARLALAASLSFDHNTGSGTLLLGTASQRGTLIRVWSISLSIPRGKTGGSNTTPTASSGIKASLRSELRRGSEQAGILSMAFAPDLGTLAAVSDKGTIHFFDLREPDSYNSTGSSPRRSPSLSAQPSSHLHPLATTLDRLAKRLPDRMFPQYVWSTWSVAQFRIKLRPFPAFSLESPRERLRGERGMRAHAAQGGSEGGQRERERMTGGLGGGGGGGGAAKSTEGAWAHLKGRVEDVRRGESALDERVFLTWVEASASASASASAFASASTSTTGRSEQERPKVKDYHLVAMTTRGAWYRIALRHSDAVSAAAQGHADEGSWSGAKASTVLDMYKESSSTATQPQSQSQRRSVPAASATLEEYRTFGGAMSGGNDDEQGASW